MRITAAKSPGVRYSSVASCSGSAFFLCGKPSLRQWRTKSFQTCSSLKKSNLAFKSKRRRAAWSSPSIRLVEAIKRSEEHTSELQSREKLVCRLLLEKTKNIRI